MRLSDLLCREAKPRPVPKASWYIFVLKICMAWISSKRSSSKRVCSVIQGCQIHKKRKFSWYIPRISTFALVSWRCNQRICQERFKDSAKHWLMPPKFIPVFVGGIVCRFCIFLRLQCMCRGHAQCAQRTCFWCFSLYWPVLVLEREIKIGLRQNWTMSHFQAGMSMQPV